MSGFRRVVTVGAVMGVLAGVVLSGTAIAQTASGSTSASAAATSSDKLIFRVGIPGDMVSPNPFKACCGYEYEMMFLAYDMLFNFNKDDLSPAPGLATDMCENSSDYMTWTCNIRSGVKWSDGEDLTSEDIAFTYKFIVDNHQPAFKDYFPYDPTFESPDPTTLVWHSTEPTFAPTIPPWVPILPPQVWQPLDGKPSTEIKGYPNVPAVGSGPFVLEDWKQGQSFTMTANNSYWGGAPTMDEVVFEEYQNKEAMVQALKSGQVDFADDLNPTLFNALKGEPNVGTVGATPSYFSNFAFNFGGQGPGDTHHPAINDLDVRLAVAHAIDKQKLVDTVYQGNAIPGTTITIPSSPWHYEPTAESIQDFDIDEANQILDDAGYKDTDGDGIREMPDGTNPLEWTVLDGETLINGGEESGKLIQGWLNEIGIKIDLQTVTSTKATSLWGDGDFDAYIWGWGGDPDPDFILSIFTTEQCLGWSDGCYSNKRFDHMYLHQKSIFNHDERLAYIGRMQQFVYDQVPEIVLVYPNYLQAYRTDTWTGYVPMPSNGGSYLFNWGPLSYINLKPVSAGSTVSSGNAGIPAWIWAVVAVVVVGGGILLFARRGRRPSEEEA
jgi:peptide/nickel transport system substrate-binding protein